jgi:hypothetical protein
LFEIASTISSLCSLILEFKSKAIQIVRSYALTQMLRMREQMLQLR